MNVRYMGKMYKRKNFNMRSELNKIYRNLVLFLRIKKKELNYHRN